MTTPNHSAKKSTTLPPKEHGEESTEPKRGPGRPPNPKPADAAAKVEVVELTPKEADAALDTVFNDALSEIGDEWKLEAEERSGPSKRLAAAINDWAKRSAAGQSAAEFVRKLNLVLLCIGLGAIVIKRAVRTFKRWRAESKLDEAKTAAAAAAPNEGLRAVEGGR